MYPSADVDRYLTIKELLISEQAQTACPGGIVKITKVDVDLKGDFEVNGSKSEATSYPVIRHRAVVVCK